MMLFVFSLILAPVTACCISEAPSTKCRARWTYFGGSCYGFADVPLTWYQAAASCISHGAHLAEIESYEENNWLVKRLRATNFGSVWIGGSEVTARGQYVWAYSGRPITFSDWWHGYPCCDPEDCVELRAEYDYKWNDWHCGNVVNRYVCETRPI
ncbi:hypothetical protein BsWGS_23764 [Bradybaena similaris]